MNSATLLAAWALGIAGTIAFGQVEAADSGHASTPDFLQRADAAVQLGHADRAVGLILPRLRRLHRAADVHLAYSTLCDAHLRQENYRMAGEACTLAAQSERAEWSDLHRLASYHYRIGDADTAAVWSARAAAMAPQNDAVTNRVEMAAAATSGSPLGE